MLSELRKELLRLKYCKYILFIIFICFFIFSSSACAVRENDVEISTFLKIDDMGSGSRELYVSFCADLLKDEQSVLEIDKMISNNCPQQLSYVKSQNSDNCPQQIARQSVGCVDLTNSL